MSTEPIPFTKLAKAVGSRDAIAEVPNDAVTATMFLTGREPIPQVRNVEVVTPTYTAEMNVPMFRVDLDLPRLSIGVHSFAPALQGKALLAKRKLLTEDDHRDALTGFLPDHLALRALPAKLDKLLTTRNKIDPKSFEDSETRWATTVFSPDDRFTFSDTAFPWCTAGRVETSSGGWASGVMVGPRHLLTCSHAIQWMRPPSQFAAGWIKFMPSYFDGSNPFGAAWGTHIYWQQQVSGPTIDGTEARNDYVVVVLDRRIGDITGWMGSRTYDDSWDGGNYWSHIGYPGDISGGTRPTFQGNFPLNGDDTQPSTNQAMYHTADVWPGQSGGPFFGWWANEPWPRVVADQSWQNGSTNGASGGSHMVDLIIRARNDFA
jgi:V8-like Glu-specific endopeptidase